MNVFVRLVVCLQCVRLGTESTKALFVNECFNGIYTCNEHEYPHVKFIAL